MTLVYASDREGPGTHALIVALGEMPGDAAAPFERAPFERAPMSAAAIANWLIEEYRNPTAPLASVAMLSSIAPGVGLAHRLPGGADIQLERPTYNAVAQAADKWFERANGYRDNVTVFYFIGRGQRHGDDVQMLFGEMQRSATPRPVEAALSVGSLREAMRACAARRQLYLVEGFGPALDEREPSTATGFLFGEPHAELPAQALIEAWIETDLPRLDPTGTVAGPSLFSSLLCETLDEIVSGPDARIATTELLLAGLLERSKILDRGRPVPSRFDVDDFDFHYPAAGAAPEADSDFVPDDAEEEQDALGRAGLAIALARRLHRIWCRAQQAPARAAAESRAAFVVHLDAPWGGGKTSFANFVGRVLNPLPAPARRPALFLRQRYPGADLGGIFLGDPPVDAAAAAALRQPPDRRRAWIVVNFNAWQAEHCAPPWWVFYQAIRTGCFDAIRREGDLPWEPAAPAASWRAWLRRRWRAGRAWLRGKDRWLALVAREYGWRLFNPKIFALLLTAGISLGLLALLASTGWWGIIHKAGGDDAGFLLGNPVGLLLSGLGGVTGLWALGALFTESIVPGTDTLAERLSLGNGDPFARFRAHFADTMAAVRRPVMVVVDDLDRCRPDFVVDLVRGIQTLLRSPRVVFVILGDRDWIERAFEAHHEAMKTVDVGPEQSFGARFVEKAIQMSFILPALGDKTQLDYLRRVLLGAPAEGAEPELNRKLAAGVNKALARAVAGQQADRSVSAAQLRTVVEEVHGLGGAAAGAAAVPGEAELARMLNERLAGQIVLDKKFEEEVAHQLEPLAPYFPSNPRQIKRIVNAITLYYAVVVALQREGPRPDKAFQQQLALWVIVMTEWPKTWRLLASFPGLVDMLAGLAPPAGFAPSGTDAAIAMALDRIRSDRKLKVLITGVDGIGPKLHDRLTTSSAATLAKFTPLHSRKHRLEEEEEEEDKSPAAPRRSARERKSAPPKPG